MTGHERPDEVVEHGQVTLRRYRAAAAALVEQAFRLPGVDRVEIVHGELNVASGGVPRTAVVWRLTR